MFRNKMIGALMCGALLCIGSIATAQDRPGVDVVEVTRMFPDARVTMMPFGQGVAKVSRIRVPTTGESFEARAAGFLRDYASAMGLDALTLEPVRTESAGNRHVVSFRQSYGGLIVIDRSLNVVMDAQGDVIRVQSDLMPVGFSQLVRGPVERETASAIATGAVWGDVPFAALDAERVIVSLEDGDVFVAWAVHVPVRPLVDHVVVLVDSRDGQIIEVRNRTILN